MVAVNDGDDDDDDDSDFDAGAPAAEDDADDDDDATFAELAGAEGSRGRVRAADPDRIRAADSDRRAKSTSTRAHAETSRERALELLAAAKSQWPLARRRVRAPRATERRRRILARASPDPTPPSAPCFNELSTVPSSVSTSGTSRWICSCVCARVCGARRRAAPWRRAVENYEVRSEAYKATLDAKKAHEKANSYSWVLACTRSGNWDRPRTRIT